MTLCRQGRPGAGRNARCTAESGMCKLIPAPPPFPLQALKNQLAPKCHVCRDGRWQDMPAKNLVPGDLIEVRAWVG